MPLLPTFTKNQDRYLLARRSLNPPDTYALIAEDINLYFPTKYSGKDVQYRFHTMRRTPRQEPEYEYMLEAQRIPVTPRDQMPKRRADERRKMRSGQGTISSSQWAGQEYLVGDPTATGPPISLFTPEMDEFINSRRKTNAKSFEDIAEELDSRFKITRTPGQISGRFYREKSKREALVAAEEVKRAKESVDQLQRQEHLVEGRPPGASISPRPHETMAQRGVNSDTSAIVNGGERKAVNKRATVLKRGKHMRIEPSDAGEPMTKKKKNLEVSVETGQKGVRQMRRRTL